MKRIKRLKAKLREQKALRNALECELYERRRLANEFRSVLVNANEQIDKEREVNKVLLGKLDYMLSMKHGDSKDAVVQALDVAESIVRLALVGIPSSDHAIDNRVLNSKEAVAFRAIHTRALGLVNILMSVKLKDKEGV